MHGMLEVFDVVLFSIGARGYTHYPTPYGYYYDF